MVDIFLAVFDDITALQFLFLFFFFVEKKIAWLNMWLSSGEKALPLLAGSGFKLSTCESRSRTIGA